MHEPFYYDRYTYNSRQEFSEKDEVSFYMEERVALNKEIETDACERIDAVVVYNHVPRKR